MKLFENVSLLSIQFKKQKALQMGCLLLLIQIAVRLEPVQEGVPGKSLDFLGEGGAAERNERNVSGENAVQFATT